MYAIFQKRAKNVKKEKKGQNISKFAKKCTKFVKDFEKGQVIACHYRTQ